MAGFVDKGFLLATSNQKIKDHVVECQITSLVWPWLSLTEKQRTINHMIIFFLMIQSISFTSAAKSYMKELVNIHCKYLVSGITIAQ